MADTQTQDQTNEANKNQPPQTNDAPTTMPETKPESKAEPSGYRGNNPSTAGPGQTHVDANVPDKAVQQLNPAAPGNTGTTPNTNAELG
jgi:hypothetical protein